MKLRKSLLALGIAGLFSGTAQAAPITFTFDPTGTPGAAGDIANVGIIDFAPGNVLAINGGVPQMLGGGAHPLVTDLYQANLAAMQAPNTTNLYANGSDSNYFTIVAGFDESATLVGPCPGWGCTALFNGVNLAHSFIEFNVNTALGDNLAGTGFATGTSILTGHLTSVVTNFSISSNQTAQLDQSPNGNQWGNTQTLQGVGGGEITFVVDYADSNYFPDLTPSTLITIGFFNTSLIDPYNQADPSQFFSSDPTQNGDIAANIGAVNGLSGPNFIFQADTNGSLAIPEPATVALLGLGLLGLGLGQRRRAA